MAQKKEAVDALKVALGMEDDGRKYYRAAARTSENALTRKMFTELGDQELVHKQILKKVYETIGAGDKYPVLLLPAGEAEKARAIFSRAIKETGTNIKPSGSEQEAIKVAMGMEMKSKDFYKSQARRAEDPVEKKFYETMAGEEQGHYLQLNDYNEYLTDPAGYFVMKERHSLDGA